MPSSVTAGWSRSARVDPPRRSARSSSACGERQLDVLARPHEDLAVVAVERQPVAGLDPGHRAAHPADHRDVEGARDDRHVRGRRALLEDHAAQPGAAVVDQLGRAERARDQDELVGQAARDRAAGCGRSDGPAGGRRARRGRAGAPSDRRPRPAPCAAGSPPARGAPPPRRSARCGSPRACCAASRRRGRTCDRPRAPRGARRRRPRAAAAARRPRRAGW